MFESAFVSTRTGSAYLQMPKGSNVWIAAYCYRKTDTVGVYLTCFRGELGDRLFARLYEDREEIEEDLCVPVQWL